MLVTKHHGRLRMLTYSGWNRRPRSSTYAKAPLLVLIGKLRFHLLLQDDLVLI